MPVIGHMNMIWEDPTGALLRGMRTHGDRVRYRYGHLDFLLLSDPEDIRHVLVTNAGAYVKSPSYDGLRNVLGRGLLTNEGASWRRQRKLAQPVFRPTGLDAFVPPMAQVTAERVAGWRSGRTLDMHQEMTRITFRIVGLTLLSADLDGEARAFGEALDRLLQYANGHAESLIKLPTWVPTVANFGFHRDRRIVDAVIQRVVQERRDARAKGEAVPADLLSMLMAATDDAGHGMDDQQLRDELVTLVTAGHETTANALAFTLFHLARHPHIERDVLAEVDAVLGDDDPTLASVAALEVLDRVVKESMRLHPPAWIFERQATQEDTIAGYRVPAGTMIGISPYVLHRHAAHWSIPDAFDPDRWLPSNAEGRHRYAYLPFGAGPRVCIGGAFAMLEAKVVLAQILRRYRVELTPGFKLSLNPGITLRPEHGIPMRLRARDSQR